MEGRVISGVDQLKDCTERKVDWNGIRKIHLIAVCGTGMGALAGLLKAQGYEVTGSDVNVYPPMSDFLNDLGVEIIPSFEAEALPENLDLVIVGNACRKDHPQVLEALKRNLTLRSFPATIGEHFMATQKSMVVAGTHGKTTTTTMLSFLLRDQSQDPTWLLGGVPLDLPAPMNLGKGEYFVIEGDEYDSAFYNKVPKFVHYRPHHVILTSVEFDHADIYDDLEAIKEAFNSLMALIPKEGSVTAWAGAPTIDEVVKHSEASVVRYGLESDFSDRDTKALWARIVDEGASGTVFDLFQGEEKKETFTTSLSGDINVRNWVAALALAAKVGISFSELKKSVARFRGIKRRQEIVAQVGECLVIDDFAHHPTAVLETLKGLKKRYADRRVWGLFEPRTQTSCRRIFQKDFEQAFKFADVVVIAQPGRKLNLPEGEVFDPQELVDVLTKKGVQAYLGSDTGHILDLIGDNARNGDVFVMMSNGAFDGIHKKAKERLETLQF